MSKLRHAHNVKDIVRSWETGAAVAALCGTIAVLDEKNHDKRLKKWKSCKKCEAIAVAHAGTGQAAFHREARARDIRRLANPLPSTWTWYSATVTNWGTK